MKNFVLIGAGGYIAPRHMQAIKETGNILLAAMDVHDSVGILDSYFPDAAFFTSIDQLDAFIDKQMESGILVDYLTVCSPNHLHEEHILFGLKKRLDVICEKPVVLNLESINKLAAAEKETDKKVFTIMQLRLHPAILELKQRIEVAQDMSEYNVEVKYITARGRWYHNSWKGDQNKSGGIATNIGIHLFDLLLWLFGDVHESIVTSRTKEKISGLLKLKNANVDWMLCINEDELPVSVKKANKRVFRSFSINNRSVDFSEGAMDLHTASYNEILAGKGFTLQATEPSVKLVEVLKNQPVVAFSK